MIRCVQHRFPEIQAVVDRPNHPILFILVQTCGYRITDYLYFVKPCSVSGNLGAKLSIIMRQTFISLLLSVILFSCTETPLQRADNDFDVRVQPATYTDTKPRLLFDEGHNNFHTTKGLYEPFAKLAENDGYQLQPLTTTVTPEALRSTAIFVISNAKGKGDLNDKAAFTEDEINIIHNWVSNGGSLLLIADHFPFGFAAQSLAAKFGISFQGGMVEDSINYDKASKDHSQLVFSKGNKLLGSHPVTNGIEKIISFTGQSIKCTNSGCTSFLQLSDAAYDLTPVTKVTKDGEDTRVAVTYEAPQSAKGRSQGIAMNYGKGKVICLGEAAMLTAQKNRDDSKVGMNYNADNKKLVLNILHWLSEK